VEQQIDRVLDIASEALVLEHGAVVYDGPVAGALRAVEKVLAARGESRQLSPVASRPQNGSAPVADRPATEGSSERTEEFMKFAPELLDPEFAALLSDWPEFVFNADTLS